MKRSARLYTCDNFEETMESHRHQRLLQLIDLVKGGKSLDESLEEKDYSTIEQAIDKITDKICADMKRSGLKLSPGWNRQECSLILSELDNICVEILHYLVFQKNKSIYSYTNNFLDALSSRYEDAIMENIILKGEKHGS